MAKERKKPSKATKTRISDNYQGAEELYGIENWGKGYFSISDEGTLLVHPTREAHRNIDIKSVVDDVAQRGISCPLLVRFPQILHSSVRELNDAFIKAIKEFEYEGVYRGVFPIKVNQKKVVVKEIIETGRKYGYGLEAGSKPELLAALSSDLPPDCLITVNGYKDEALIKLALNGIRMGKKVILILEKISELEKILAVAKKRGVKPLIGTRCKLYAKGSGKWAKSGGEAAKFGLTTTEILETVEILKNAKMLDSLVMLHFHIGSQITDIRKIKDAIKEAGRVYAKLSRSLTEISYLNLGGGLGVDYDGSKTAFDSSMNYTVQEYANDVVYNIKQICEEEKVSCPILVTESGRSVTAYHSILVTNVVDVADRLEQDKKVTLDGDENTVVRELFDVLKGVTAKNVRESYHDALQYKEELFTLFNLGYVSLEDRSKGEILFWNICDKIRRHLKSLKEIPEEFEDLDVMLSDKYVLNFSVFQSVPDSWAIDQLFPILPIHRLREKPQEHGTLADITCDSDGKIEKFIDIRDIKESLPLHNFKRSHPYYLAICLIGAYQDVLGDLHNLFGEANEVLAVVDESGRTRIQDILPGETCERVLSYINYEKQDILDGVSRQLGRNLDKDLMKDAEAKAILKDFENVLTHYTYLDV